VRLGEFFRRIAIFRTSLTLLIALIAGLFLALSVVVSLSNGEWLRALKTLGLLVGIGLLSWWAVIVGKAQTKRRDKPVK
jgi:cyanate permease